MKKALFIWVSLLFVATLHAEPLTDHGGFNPDYRGAFNNPNENTYDLEGFKKAMKEADETGHVTKYFIEKYFIEEFMANVPNGNSLTLEQVLNELEARSAPAGFYETTMASHEMSAWNQNKIMYWAGARNPWPGEVFLWFRGHCIMSLFCGNLLREVIRITPPVTPKPKSEIPQEGAYMQQDREGQVIVGKVPENGNVIVQVNANPTANANPVNTQSAPAASGGGYGLSPTYVVAAAPSRGGGGGYEEGTVQRREIRYSEPGLGFKNVATGIGVGLIGVADMWRAVNNDRQDINLTTRSYNNQTWTNNTGWNNGGGWNTNPVRQYNYSDLNPPQQVQVNNGSRRYNESQLSSNIATNYGGSSWGNGSGWNTQPLGN